MLKHSLCALALLAVAVRPLSAAETLTYHGVEGRVAEYRLTLTATFINRAAAVAFLVAGAAKAAVVRDVIEGPRGPGRLPAQLIRPEPGELHWLIDKAAAGELS